MTSSSREVIDRAIISALAESQCVALSISSSAAHPRQYAVVRDDQYESIWVYCWTLTPGGRPSLPHEYRIQMTSVGSPLPQNPDGHTLLLGYEPGRRVFAAYDIERHSAFTAGSSSVQVNSGTLNEALQSGLSFETKSNDEIVIGVRSDFLYLYAQQAAVFHEMGQDSRTFAVVQQAAEAKAVDESALAELSENRRKVVQETSRWTRSNSFRRQVLNAYENRCAVTRHQMGSIDAAHILPVKAGAASIDDVRNGISLSPTYHRAFDNGLIFLDTNLEMRLNPAAVAELQGLGLDGGVQEFSGSLGKIHLPQNAQQRPEPDFITLANEFRGLSH